MRRLAEWSLAAVDECGPHAIRFRANAVEGMIGNKQDAGTVIANDLLGFRIGFPVRLEIAGLLHRNDVIEWKAYVRPSGFQHVAVAVRQDCQLVSLGPEFLESSDDIRKGLEFFDLANEPTYLLRCVRNSAAIHDVRDRAMSDLPVRRMPAIA